MLLHSGTMLNSRFAGIKLSYQFSFNKDVLDEPNDLEQELLVKLYDAFHGQLIPAVLRCYCGNAKSFRSRRRKVTGHLHAYREDGSACRLTVKLRVTRHISSHLDSTELVRLLEEYVLQPVSIEFDDWCTATADRAACTADCQSIEAGIHTFDLFEPAAGHEPLEEAAETLALIRTAA